MELVPYTNDGHVLRRDVSSDKRLIIRQLRDTFIKRLKVSVQEIEFWEISLEETH